MRQLIRNVYLSETLRIERNEMWTFFVLSNVLLLFRSIIGQCYIPPQLNFRSRRLPNWLQMNIMKSHYHMKWMQFFSLCQSKMYWHFISFCLSLFPLNNHRITKTGWNGNTYGLGIQVTPSMGSHRAVYHRRHKYDAPMKLNHTNQDRAEFVHCHVFHRYCVADLIASLMDLAAENYWIAHSTHEDIDRYHFHIEDFVNSSLYDVLIDLEIALKHLDNRKLIDNHRLYFRGCNTNLWKKVNESMSHIRVLSHIEFNRKMWAKYTINFIHTLCTRCANRWK